MRETLENSNLQVNIHGIYKLISWNLQVNPVIFVRFWSYYKAILGSSLSKLFLFFLGFLVVVVVDSSSR